MNLKSGAFISRRKMILKKNSRLALDDIKGSLSSQEKSMKYHVYKYRTSESRLCIWCHTHQKYSSMWRFWNGTLKKKHLFSSCRCLIRKFWMSIEKPRFCRYCHLGEMPEMLVSFYHPVSLTSRLIRTWLIHTKFKNRSLKLVIIGIGRAVEASRGVKGS